MGIGPVARKESASSVSRSGGSHAAAATLSLGSDSFRFKPRDGGPERPPIIETPGANKLAIGGAIAGSCIVGLGLTLSVATMPFWVPLAFGAGVLVGGAILLKGATEYAKHLSDKIGQGLTGNLPK